MKSLLFTFILFLTSLILSKAEDNYFDQLPTVTDTIRFNNFEYSVDTKYMDYPSRYDTTFKEYLQQKKIFQTAFKPNWRFECVQKFDSLIIAHFFSETVGNCKIQLQFYDKNKYNRDSLNNIFSLNDTISYVSINKDRDIIPFLKNAMEINADRLDVPLPMHKIPDKIKTRIQNNINEEKNEEKEKSEAGETYYGDYRDNVEDYYVTYSKEEGYDYYIENPYRELKKFRAYKIVEDSNFLIFFVLVTEEREDFYKNIEHFKQICSSFKFITDNHKFDDKLYTQAKTKFKYKSPLFLSAYKENDEVAFKKYLDLASEKDPSVPDSILNQKTQLEKEVYAIFSKFYNPMNPSHEDFVRRRNEYWDSINPRTSTQYYLVQSELDVSLYSDLVFQHDTTKSRSYRSPWNVVFGTKISKMEIYDFRPTLEFKNSKIIHLSSDFEDFIDNFIKSDFYALGTGSIMNPATAKGLSQIRVGFLNYAFEIYPYHWGGGWHIPHVPISGISLNKNLDKAVFHFRYGYSWGRLLLKKNNEEWTLIDGRITGME